ncbi:MAG: FAD-dependent oxidoreductase [Actinomycetaceae bacterium]|nr:FAD-dependent oxidoreductase [Actinomycetaceae bacterium]
MWPSASISIADARGAGTVSIRPENVCEAAVENSRAHEGGCKGFKIWIKIKGHNNIMAYAPSGHPIALIRSEYFLDDGTTVCVGFGPDRDKIRLDDVEMVQEIVNQWNPALEVVDSTGHDWGTDEWTGQTWTTPKQGQFVMTGPQSLGENSRLLLAGSDWAAGWNSFVDGAIETGIKTAREINQRAGS